jgi:hypothetical protein
VATGCRKRAAGGPGGPGSCRAGPGLREDWLADLRREGLIGELLADGVIAAAVAEGGHGHRLDRALTAEVTALCGIAGSLFPDQGYDLTLARVFGMPGVPVKPGTAFGLELTVFDGTTAGVFNDPVLAAESGSLRAAPSRRSGSSRTCRPARGGGRPPKPRSCT